MDQLWKWVMHLNAKAFCLAATLFFCAVASWCGFCVLNPPAPLKDGSGPLPEGAQPWSFNTLALVTNQLAADALHVPVDPFRPTIEAIFTNETERAAFLKALRAAQNAAAGIANVSNTGKKEDPFAHLRRKDPAAGGGLTGPNGQPMVIPKLSFLGFFQRPDGTKAAMFHDSATDRTVFYDAGKQVHGVDVVNANVKEAEIRFADGTSRKLEIGGSVELPAEPDTRPKKAAVPAPADAVKPAAAGPAAGAKQKPLAKQPGAQQKPVPRQPQKPVQKPDQKQAKPLKAPRQPPNL
jgi:hypothetical protein